MQSSNAEDLEKDAARWNIGILLLFPLLFLILVLLFEGIYGRVPFRLTVFDFFLLTLATYRLIRLFVYDSITLPLREWFARGAGPRRALFHIVTCPWCSGIWMAFFVVFFFYFFPEFWIFLLLLAVSALASFFQLLTNWVGWNAERSKREVEKML